MNLNNRPRRLRILIRILVPATIIYFLGGLFVDYRSNQFLDNPEKIEAVIWNKRLAKIDAEQPEDNSIVDFKVTGFYAQSRPRDYLMLRRRIIVNYEYAHEFMPTATKKEHNTNVYITVLGVFVVKDSEGW